MQVRSKLPLVLLGVVMVLVIAAAFLYAEPAEGLGEASRVVFFHIPAAWVAVLSFLVSAIMSIKYLRTTSRHDDHSAAAAAGLGLVFTLVATITGSIFANLMWGSPWNWDPRETTIFVLLLIYLAYFALRSAVEDEQRRGRLAAVYAIIAFVTVPFLVFILPRVLGGLHPDPVISSSGQVSLKMSPRMLQVFLSSLLAFTWLFALMYRLEVRVADAQDRIGR
jgi:heme exporter protein C